MQKAKQRLTSLVMACVMVIACLFGAIATLVMPQTTAVAAEGDKYVKVTSAPTDWSGDYLIVYETGKVAFNGGLSTLDAASNTISVTISNGEIAATDNTNAAKFTIAKSGTSYTIKSASGYVIGNGAKKNQIQSSKTGTYTNTLSYDTSKKCSVITASSGYTLQYNKTSGQTRFRYFGSAQEVIQLYKYTETQSGGEGGDTACTHEKTTTATVEATCTTSGSETVTCDDCGKEISKKDIQATGHNYVDKVCTVCGAEQKDIYSYTFTEQKFDANETKELGGVNWTLAGDGNYWGYDGTKGQQFGSGNAPYKSLALTSTDFTGVSKIVINTSGASSVSASFTVSVGGTQVGDSKNLTASATKYTFETESALTGAIVFSYTQTSSKAIYIKSIEVTYTEGEAVVIPEELTTALNNVEASMSLSYSYTVTEKAIPAGVTFELGDDGIATHADGSSTTTYSETVDGYTLNITSGTNMYQGARDAKGNSCIKLGTSSATGGFTFTVPADITTVIIAVGKYKDNASNITVNGTAYTLTKNSNDGEYDEITVDTTTTKTITLTTVSGGVRAMVNSIIFANDTMESAGTKQVVEKGNSEFRIRFSVDASLADIAKIETLDKEKSLELGIRVSTGAKIAHYAISECQTLKNANDEIIKYYVVISLGDIFNDDIKLGTDFTVQAYAKYDGKEVLPAEPAEGETSNAIKTYSVKSMVAAYYNGEKATAVTTAKVAHLYNYLTTGKIA